MSRFSRVYKFQLGGSRVNRMVSKGPPTLSLPSKPRHNLTCWRGAGPGRVGRGPVLRAALKHASSAQLSGPRCPLKRLCPSGLIFFSFMAVWVCLLCSLNLFLHCQCVYFCAHPLAPRRHLLSTCCSLLSLLFSLAQNKTVRFLKTQLNKTQTIRSYEYN